MKWFKHMSDASDDEFLQRVEDLFGLEGYARWWKLLEVIASEISESHPEPSAEFTWKKWGEKLRGKPNKLKSFLEYSENQTKIKLEQNGIILKITCYKLLELRDNHTKNLQVTGKQLSIKFPLDIEEDKERKNNPLTPLKGGTERLKKVHKVEGQNGKVNPRTEGTNPRAIAEKENQVSDGEKAYHMKYRRDRFGHILDTTAERWLKDYESKNGVIDLEKKAKPE